MLGVSIRPLVTNKPHQKTALKHQVTFQDEIVMEDGLSVVIHRKLDQGDSVRRCVYLAQNSRATSRRQKRQVLYALKRIDCRDDRNEVEKCRREMESHRILTQLKNENLMPLLGCKMEERTSRSGATIHVCYMLLPYITHSLRDDFNSRHLLEDVLESQRRPYSEQELLRLVHGIVQGVEAIHSAGLSHRDLKPDNILLQRKQGKRRNGDNGSIPVITDFGSAGPMTVPTESWPDIIHAIEEVDKTTTIAYRAPELFGGGLAYGPTEMLHFDYADVWSLGCVLFSMMYGASPFQTEWRISLVEGAAAEGTMRLVECTRSRVIQAHIPFPPLGGAADRRYSRATKDLVLSMLQKERRERPTCSQLAKRIETILHGNRR